jgi:hypothetical protein
VFLTRTARQKAERLRDEIRDFLRENCGLELSAEKTRITHVRDGYEFLGFNISVDVGHAGNPASKLRVGRKAITNIQKRLGDILRYCPTQDSISVRLERASAVIRGWSKYFKIAHNFSQVAHATAFIAVDAGQWSHPGPRVRTTSYLSTALQTSIWRTAWTTSRHSVCAVVPFCGTAASQA